MEPFTFRNSQRVNYSHCTVGNHVYHSRYLDLLEAARGEFFRALGLPLSVLQQGNLAFPVTECHISYFAPARYDEVVTTDLWPGRGALLSRRRPVAHACQRGSAQFLLPHA